ncbi:MAG: SDR family oxidoreductase [Pirellulales bacterium]|nr:SDR family oxidoreductase [Pirellulales bacterium]
MAKLIFGCGYLGARVARLWQQRGEQVHAVTRSAETASRWRFAGLSPIVADVTQPASLRDLPLADTVLYAVGHDRAAAPTMHEVYVAGLTNALAALASGIGRFIYISSTSVYGQTDGSWVNEDSPCEPRRENGRLCLQAETLLAQHPLGRRSVRLRLAGLYGPGRIPRASAILAGEPIAAPQRGHLNLIHVDDAARVVLAAEELAVPPARLYTVCDDLPVVRACYYEEMARLLGAPAPTFAPPPPDSPARRRAETDKQVSNSRLRQDIDIQLKFPTYREGLAAIVREAGANATGENR